MTTPSSALRALPSIPYAPPGRQRALAEAPLPVRIHGSDAAISTSDAHLAAICRVRPGNREDTQIPTFYHRLYRSTGLPGWNAKQKKAASGPSPRGISVTRRPLWAVGVQPHIPRRAGHLPTDRTVERGRCLIPAASRSTTSAMRSTNVRPAGRRVDPPEVRLAAELRQRTGENAPAAGSAGGAFATSSARSARWASSPLRIGPPPPDQPPVPAQRVRGHLPAHPQRLGSSRARDCQPVRRTKIR